MTRRLIQPKSAEPQQQIRPWGLSGLVGRVIVAERERPTGRPGENAVDVACGVLESAHRASRNNVYQAETTLIFRGGGQFSFRENDLVIIDEAEDPA